MLCIVLALRPPNQGAQRQGGQHVRGKHRHAWAGVQGSISSFDRACAWMWRSGGKGQGGEGVTGQAGGYQLMSNPPARSPCVSNLRAGAHTEGGSRRCKEASALSSWNRACARSPAKRQRRPVIDRGGPTHSRVAARAAAAARRRPQITQAKRTARCTAPARSGTHPAGGQLPSPCPGTGEALARASTDAAQNDIVANMVRRRQVVVMLGGGGARTVSETVRGGLLREMATAVCCAVTAGMQQVRGCRWLTHDRQCGSQCS